MGLFSTTASAGNGSRRWRWTLAGTARSLFFFFTGLVFCLCILFAVKLLGLSEFWDFWLTLGAILIVPPALVVGAVALREGLQDWSILRTHFRWYWWIWFLMFISDFTWRQRSAVATEANPLDPAAWARIGPEIIIGLVLLFGLARRRVDWPNGLFKGLLAAVVVFCLIGTISSLWSVYKAFTLYKSLEFLLDTAILAAVLCMAQRFEEYEEFWNFNWVLQGVTLFWVWMGMAIWPSEALQPVPGTDSDVPRLQGVVPVVGYNAVGVVGAVLAVVALARLFPLDNSRRTNRAWYACLLAYGVATMFLAQTRSAIGGFALAAILMLLIAGRFYLLVATGALAGASLLLTPLGSYAWEFISRSQSAQKLESLSGRTNWWAYAYEIWKTHPYTGVGLYAGGKFAVLEKLVKSETPTLHSDWLEIFVGTSVWGLIPIIALVIGCWWVLVKYHKDPNFSIGERQLMLEALGLLAVLTIRSFFNVELVWHAPSLFFPVVGYAEFIRRRAKRRRSEVPSEGAVALARG